MLKNACRSGAKYIWKIKVGKIEGLRTILDVRTLFCVVDVLTKRGVKSGVFENGGRYGIFEKDL
jgi:hypothetical protein